LSWPFGPDECPRCLYFQLLEPPVFDDAGYETVGLCRHPAIATDLFVMRARGDPGTCPCFVPDENESESATKS
jgi:hypothetical protein